MDRQNLTRGSRRRAVVLLAAGALLLAGTLLPAAPSARAEPFDPTGARWRANLTEWRRARGTDARREAGEQLVWSAMRADRPDLVEAVAAGSERRLREGEIHLPRRRARRVRLTTVREFPELRTDANHFPREDGDWLARRITRDAFEVWSPRHGWLFDGDGRLLNEARPPRRDGVGREWFGAFLPDGRWVTTDLWEWDRALTFFSREGQWLREIPGDVLLPRTAEEMKHPSWTTTGDFLITWARSDWDGHKWIVQVGSDGGRGRVQVGADGSFQPLPEAEDMGWSRCYPRQLGPRGTYTGMSVPDDAGRLELGFHVPGHGYTCGYPEFYTRDNTEKNLLLRVANADERFGFWPGETDWFVVATRCRPPRPGEDSEHPADDLAVEATWFFDQRANFQGWVRAGRLADAADGRAMLFLTPDHRVVTLDRQRRVRGVRRFVLANGKTAMPLTLFADLRLGFFRDGNHVVLARWER